MKIPIAARNHKIFLFVYHDTSFMNNITHLPVNIIETKNVNFLSCCSRSGLWRSQLEFDRHAQRSEQQGQLEGSAEPEAEEKVLRKHLHHQRSRHSRNIWEFRTRRSCRTGIGIGSDRGKCSDVSVGFSEVGPEVGRHDGAVHRQVRRGQIDAVAFSTVSTTYITLDD